jgi:cytochrome c oxidase assembly protein subunit 11
VWILGGVAAVMFALGFAMAPLYSLICEWTGLRQAVRPVAEIGAGPAVAREVTVRFDANVASGLPWGFKPLDRKLEVHLGKISEARFLAFNHAHEAVVGQAIPNVVPLQAGKYFNKIACFCFQQQRLEPGEAREMTVRFAVSPDLPEDINSLLLSYTFMNRDPQSAKKYADAHVQNL